MSASRQSSSTRPPALRSEFPSSPMNPPSCLPSSQGRSPVLDSKVAEEPCPSEVALNDFLGGKRAAQRVSIPASPQAIILKGEWAAEESSNPKAVLISVDSQSESVSKVVSKVVRSPTGSTTKKSSTAKKSGSSGASTPVSGSQTAGSGVNSVSSGQDSFDLARRFCEMEKENRELRSQLQEATMKDLMKGVLETVQDDYKLEAMRKELDATKKELAALKKERTQFTKGDKAWQSDTNGIAANFSDPPHSRPRTSSTSSSKDDLERTESELRPNAPAYEPMSSRMTRYDQHQSSASAGTTSSGIVGGVLPNGVLPSTYYPTPAMISATPFPAASPVAPDNVLQHKSLSGWDALATQKSPSGRSRGKTGESQTSTVDNTPHPRGTRDFQSRRPHATSSPALMGAPDNIKDILSFIASEDNECSVQSCGSSFPGRNNIAPPGMTLPRPNTLPQAIPPTGASSMMTPPMGSTPPPPGLDAFMNAESGSRPNSGSTMASSVPEFGRFGHAVSTNKNIRPPDMNSRAEGLRSGAGRFSALQPNSSVDPNHRPGIINRFDSLSSDGVARPQYQIVGASVPTARASSHYVPPPPQPKELSPEDTANYHRLVELCDGLGVEPRTTEWFTSSQYSHLWIQMINKIDELNRRKNGEVNVKNPAAWLTKFFNIIRVDPEEPARNRAMRGSGSSRPHPSRHWLGPSSAGNDGRSQSMSGSYNSRVGANWYS